MANGQTLKTQRRTDKIKAATKIALRDKFKGLEYIRQLENSSKEYTRILDSLKKASTNKLKLSKKDKETLFAINCQIEVLKAQQDVVKGQIDLNIRRLKFCLPELKSVELTDPNGDNPFSLALIALSEAAKNC